MILKINEKEIIKAKYFRKFNVVTKSLKDLRSKWLEIGSLWGFGNIWVIGKVLNRYDSCGHWLLCKKEKVLLGIADRWK